MTAPRLLGALGLVATKNLVEEGFDVTGFERNAYVGGLWHYTDDDRTSVLPSESFSLEAHAVDGWCGV